MKKRTLLSMAMVATMMMSTFVGCGGGRDGATDTSSAETATETTTEAAAEAGAGFEKGATVGISLPWLGT